MVRVGGSHAWTLQPSDRPVPNYGQARRPCRSGKPTCCHSACASRCRLNFSTSIVSAHYSYLLVLQSLLLQSLLLHCSYCITLTSLLLLHCSYCITLTASLLLHCSYCIVLTASHLLHHSYCISITRHRDRCLCYCKRNRMQWQ